MVWIIVALLIPVVVVALTAIIRGGNKNKNGRD